MSIVTDTLVLKGELDGSVTQGVYQTRAAEPTQTLGDITYQTARGLREAQAGQLVIGDPGPSSNSGTDRGINTVVFMADTDAITVDEALENGITYISTDRLNRAGLGSLSVAANLSIDVQADATISLAASQGTGELLFKARRIDHHGAIDMPGGSVFFYNDVNITNGEDTVQNVPLLDSAGNGLDEAIVLYDGSIIDVSGETWDNWSDPDAVPDRVHLSGGEILLQARGTQSTDQAMDAATGVFIESGATLDVSGGYSVGVGGDIAGADAGAIEITGRSVLLNGDMLGQSLVGYGGGRLAVNAGNTFTITHATDGGSFAGAEADTISDAWIAQSGFAALSFASDSDLLVADQVVLAPSDIKFIAPIQGLQAGGTMSSPEYDIEDTSISLAANQTVFTRAGSTSTDHVTISQSARVSAGTGGSLSLEGAVVDVQGSLSTHGGTITVEATADAQDLAANESYAAALIIGSQALIDASGIAVRQATPLAQGLPRPYTVYGGGDVVLEASGNGGAIQIAGGALIDVSGSPRVDNYYRDRYGRAIHYTLAAPAGSIALTAGQFDVQGQYLARNYHDGLTGGALVIQSTDYLQPYQISEADLLGFAAGGFDSWQFSSVNGLQFVGDIDVSRTRMAESALTGDWVNPDWSLRELVLDAPMILTDSSDAENQNVRIDATYIQLANLDAKFPGDFTTAQHSPSLDYDSVWTSALLQLDSQWLDIAGSVAIQGFGTVSLAASQDVRLIETFYEQNSEANTGQWAGRLAVTGDLVLTAGRIYPDTDTTFTISTGRALTDGSWQGGGLTIAQAEGTASSGPILSANGELIIETNHLLHEGTVLAPMGRIVLQGTGADSEIVLAENSVLSTSADAAVSWGYYQSDRWVQVDRGSDRLSDVVEIDTEPERYIDISAQTVTAQEGSTIDVSGGGTVYAAEFEPSIKGSADPLNTGDRYVILADNSVQLPGAAVYLEGIAGLAAGTYSLLPADYAFLPGALIIEDQGAVYDISSVTSLTAAGYARPWGMAPPWGKTGPCSTRPISMWCARRKVCSTKGPTPVP